MLTAKLATRVDIPRAVTTGLTDQRKWAKMSNQFTHTYRHAGAGGSARRRRPLDGDQRHPGCCCSDLGHLGEWRAGIQDIILGRHYDTASPWGYFSGRLLSFLSGIKLESVHRECPVSTFFKIKVSFHQVRIDIIEQSLWEFVFILFLYSCVIMRHLF